VFAFEFCFKFDLPLIKKKVGFQKKIILCRNYINAIWVLMLGLKKKVSSHLNYRYRKKDLLVVWICGKFCYKSFNCIEIQNIWKELEMKNSKTRI
jgi:hypothetical protein